MEDYPIYVCEYVFPLLLFLSLCGCGMSMLNNELKHIWLRKLLGFIWEAGIQHRLWSCVYSLELCHWGEWGIPWGGPKTPMHQC